MAATTGNVRGLRQAVQDNFVRRKSRGKRSEHVAVVREEIVLVRSEGEPEGDLYAIVTRVRGVVRPPFRLSEVVTRLVVEQPPKMNQSVPFELFFNRSRPSRVSERLVRKLGNRTHRVYILSFVLVFFSTPLLATRMNPGLSKAGSAWCSAIRA